MLLAVGGGAAKAQGFLPCAHDGALESPDCHDQGGLLSGNIFTALSPVHEYLQTVEIYIYILQTA